MLLLIWNPSFFSYPPLLWGIGFPFLLSAFAFLSPTSSHRSYSRAVLSMLLFPLCLNTARKWLPKGSLLQRGWTWSCTSFRPDLCSSLCTAFKLAVLSGHKQGQRDVENYLHIPLAHCGSSTKPSNIFVGFWLLCIKIVKWVSWVREMGGVSV